MGLMGGNKAEVPLGPILTKQLRIVGSMLRNRSNGEKAEITREFRSKVLPLLAAGKVRPVVDRVFPMQDVEIAHLRMRNNEHFGKMVLTWQVPLPW
jgi:NADPH:quinone reductase-like Zn-dependent oxidoreductase